MYLMSSSPVTALLDHLSQPMAQVDDLILTHMQSDIPLIPEIGKHIVSSGGKRVRPLLTLAAAELVGAREMSGACQLAASVEFIHTATLLHDDVVDGSDLRRGTPTANMVWGNKAPVLVGDFLFSRAFELMVAVGRLDVLQILSAASATIAEGEVHQLKTANDLGTTQDDYLAVIGAKTAALFDAAMQVGGLVADASAVQLEALKTYGHELGLAFQMADDALDFAATAKDMGKAAGDDFREGKVTLPIILAYAAGDEEQKAFWRRCIERLDQQEADLETALAYLDQHQAIAQTLTQAEASGTRAKAALDVFADGPLKAMLCGLIDFVVHRTH